MITPEQYQEAIDAYTLSGNNMSLASKSLGLPRSTAHVRIKAAIEKGYKPSPDADPTLNGASVMHVLNSDGRYDKKVVWAKKNKDEENQKEILKAFADGFKEEIPKADPVDPPTLSDPNLLALYVLSDFHIGMRSNNWNLEEAEKVCKLWVHRSVKASMNAETAILCFQGDTEHWDSLTPVTPANNHVLDACCTTRMMARLTIKLIRYCVNTLLKHHKNVHIIYCLGNHDESNATVHSEWIAAHYEDENRVSVDESETVYHCYEWGNTSLFFHHGHKRKTTDIDRVLASAYHEVFGRTKYRFLHLGHLHHSASSETQLMKIEIHPTLADKDEYALNGGWYSQRGANTIIYHKKYGEVSRVITRPEMLDE